MDNDNLNYAIFWEDDETLSEPFESKEAADEFLAESKFVGHVVGYAEGEREKALEHSREYNSPYFEHGLEVGHAIGHSDAVSEALRAHEMGELELWLEAMTPKSMEDWQEWEAQYGKNFSDRWKKK